jgi:hypothetical protein
MPNELTGRRHVRVLNIDKIWCNRVQAAACVRAPDMVHGLRARN